MMTCGELFFFFLRWSIPRCLFSGSAVFWCFDSLALIIAHIPVTPYSRVICLIAPMIHVVSAFISYLSIGRGVLIDLNEALITLHRPPCSSGIASMLPSSVLGQRPF